MQVWLTVSEASPILKMSTQAIYTAIRERQVPKGAILRIGRRIRINVEALQNAESEFLPQETESSQRFGKLEN